MEIENWQQWNKVGERKMQYKVTSLFYPPQQREQYNAATLSPTGSQLDTSSSCGRRNNYFNPSTPGAIVFVVLGDLVFAVAIESIWSLYIINRCLTRSYGGIWSKL